jgi:ArsR family transcriptional regulator
MAVRAKKAPVSKLTPRQRERIAKALADPRRFDILKHIASGRCTACTTLRADFPVTAATLSHHLKELETAGLIETMRRGKFVDVIFCRDTLAAYLAELGSLGN